MQNKIVLPANFQAAIDSEEIDFSILSKRSQPINKSISTIFLGLITTVLCGLLFIHVVGPDFEGDNKVHYTAQGEKYITDEGYTPERIISIFFLGIFVYAGVKLLLMGIKPIIQNGGYFVGTSNHLIHYYKGNITSYEWKQFTGNIQGNKKKKYLILDLHTGKMVSSKNHMDKYVHDTVYISGLKNGVEIEAMCKERIAEKKSNATSSAEND